MRSTVPAVLGAGGDLLPCACEQRWLTSPGGRFAMYLQDRPVPAQLEEGRVHTRGGSRDPYVHISICVHTRIDTPRPRPQEATVLGTRRQFRSGQLGMRRFPSGRAVKATGQRWTRARRVSGEPPKQEARDRDQDTVRAEAVGADVPRTGGRSQTGPESSRDTQTGRGRTC